MNYTQSWGARWALTLALATTAALLLFGPPVARAAETFDEGEGMADDSANLWTRADEMR